MTNPATNGTGMLLKIGVGVITTLLTAAIIAIAANLASLNREMIGLQAWRAQLDASDSALRNTVPRQEMDLRERIIAGQIEQLRVRMESLERAQ